MYDANGDAVLEEKAAPAWLVFAAGMLVGVGMTWLLATAPELQAEEPTPTPGATIATTTGAVEVFVYTDDSGAQYLVTDTGDITPRLDYDGWPIVISRGE